MMYQIFSMDLLKIITNTTFLIDWASNCSKLKVGICISNFCRLLKFERKKDRLLLNCCFILVNSSKNIVYFYVYTCYNPSFSEIHSLHISLRFISFMHTFSGRWTEIEDSNYRNETDNNCSRSKIIYKFQILSQTTVTPTECKPWMIIYNVYKPEYMESWWVSLNKYYAIQPSDWSL